MLDAVVNMFTRRDPRREAALALTRIMNRYDMVRLSYEEGIFEDRRGRDERHVAMGVWLFPCDSANTGHGFNVGDGVPAVTHDLRSSGFGIMTPVRLTHSCYVVATQEDDTGWKFFRCQVRHNTCKPGGWFHLGMEVERVLTLDSDQRIEFRDHVKAVQSVQV